MKQSLQSTVETLGKYVTQIIHFSNGNKRTITNVETNTIVQGEFTKFKSNGRLILVNTANVDMIEIFPNN